MDQDTTHSQVTGFITEFGEEAEVSITSFVAPDGSGKVDLHFTGGGSQVAYYLTPEAAEALATQLLDHLRKVRG